MLQYQASKLKTLQLVSIGRDEGTPALLVRCRGSCQHTASAFRFQKPWLSMTERGHYMYGWRFNAQTVGEFPRNKFFADCIPHKSHWDETINPGPVCIRTQKDQILTMETPQSSSADYGNNKTPSTHRWLGSVTLLQLAFPGENNWNFSWEKSRWDNTIVKKKGAIFQ